MKTIVVGDTHGRSFWKFISETEKWDKFIFIGDYFDAYQDFTAIDQLKNFDEICEFKRKNKEKVIMLVGNHDFHYMKAAVGERYSGYQNGASPNIQIALEDAMKEGLLQMCHVDGEYCFTHAGVTKTWMTSVGYYPAPGEEHVTRQYLPVQDFINEVFKYKPLSFRFQGHDMYGDDPTQSPIWVRPQSLYNDMLTQFTHVIGHTQVPKINIPKGERSGMLLIDTLGSSKEYLIITDGVPSVGKV